MSLLIEMKNIRKEFPGVVALQNIHFQLRAGEVHVLLGENGAGKSTLMKILSGAYEPTGGSILIYGKEYAKLTPQESVENKIGIIYQELSVINELSIAENIFVGKLPQRRKMGVSLVDYSYMNKRAAELLKQVGLNKPPETLVETLSVSEKQLVEIAKALASDARILIMDEPTSSLTIDETNNLFAIIRELKKKGTGIIYISHKLKELKEIGDRITVLKDGQYVATKNVGEVEIEDLITMMVGRELKEKYLNSQHEQQSSNEILFEVKKLTRKDRKVEDISFQLFKNEILGFAGLIGAGRTELMNAIFRADKVLTGEMYLYGEKLDIQNPYQAMKKGIGFLTENRRETGIFKNFEIWKNISLAPLLRKSKLGGMWGLLDRRKEKQVALEQKQLLQVKCADIEQNIAELSGGNQQKVLVGKWLAADAKLLIFDEPTKGIDVGAKSEIYAIMRSLANQGKGVLMVSSELPELLAVCDRIVVFREGRIKAVMGSDEATEEKIMFAATSE